MTFSIYAICLTLGTAVAVSTAAAQTYPDRPIRMIVPFTPGGVSDITARPLAAAMAANLGQPFVIENKGGAGGAIGMAAAAKAGADGYNVLMALPSVITIPIADRLSGRPPSFQLNHFRPLARLTADPTVLAVRADSPWKTLGDFVKDARANPNKLSYSSSGLHGTTHVAMEILARAADVQLVHVPYTGGGAQITALLAGHVQATMQTPGAIAQYISGDKFRILASMGRERLPSMPDVPTARELGYDGEFYLWTGVFVPAATPEPIVARLRSSIREAVAQPIFRSAMSTQGTPIQYLDANAFSEFLAGDTQRLERALSRTGKLD